MCDTPSMAETQDVTEKGTLHNIIDSYLIIVTTIVYKTFLD